MCLFNFHPQRTKLGVSCACSIHYIHRVFWQLVLCMYSPISSYGVEAASNQSHPSWQNNRSYMGPLILVDPPPPTHTHHHPHHPPPPPPSPTPPPPPPHPHPHPHPPATGRGSNSGPNHGDHPLSLYCWSRRWKWLSSRDPQKCCVTSCD